ncbi:MAG: rod shape-determining protein RodA [Candidatus Aphodosoma sp.]|nr:rod shape-determining protein RodA [Candidatus Aphodosoma sp.]
MSKSFNVLGAVDKPVIIMYLALVIIGLMNIYGASYSEEQTSIFDLSYRSGKQILWIGISFVVAICILFSSKSLYSAVAYWLYGLIIIALIVTLFIATDIKGSRSWITLGGFSIQPAEFSKFVTALALAKFMDDTQFKLLNPRNFVIVAALIFIPMLIIVMQKETGSALVYLSFMFMLYREGLPGIFPSIFVGAVILFVVVIRYSGDLFLGVDGASLGLIIGLMIVLIVALILCRALSKEYKFLPLIILGSVVAIIGVAFIIHYFFIPLNFVYVIAGINGLLTLLVAVFAFIKWRKQYVHIIAFILLASLFCFSVGYLFDNVLQHHQQMRIMVLLGMADDPSGISYNTNQAKIAIGSGGFIGKGFLQGTQTKLKYVPEQDTDFIFCTVGEEWGFIGSVVVLGIFLFFLLRLVVLAEKAESRFVRIYGYCVVGIFAFHLFINVGMVLGLAPVIGIPLPFFSYGGSSFLSFTILLMIFLKLDTIRKERVSCF